jgi:hypothetical protein
VKFVSPGTHTHTLSLSLLSLSLLSLSLSLSLAHTHTHTQAGCSEEGVIRIYEAMDIMNLSSWTQEQDFKVKGKGKCSALSWNPSR